MNKDFPNYIQKTPFDCGLTCVKIIAKHYGKIIDVSDFNSDISKKGMSIYDLCTISEEIGFKSNAYEISLNQLLTLEKPIVLHWNKNHYVVLYKGECKYNLV